MRALVVYSATGRLAVLAQALGEGLREVGYDVQLLEAQESVTHFSAAPFDLVCVGSPVKGFWGKEIADDAIQVLKRLSRLEGKAAVAFVRSRLLWGNARGLRILMAELEKQGALVQDFAAVSKPADARQLGKRLGNIAGE